IRCSVSSCRANERDDCEIASKASEHSVDYPKIQASVDRGIEAIPQYTFGLATGWEQTILPATRRGRGLFDRDRGAGGDDPLPTSGGLSLGPIPVARTALHCSVASRAHRSGRCRLGLDRRSIERGAGLVNQPRPMEGTV